MREALLGHSFAGKWAKGRVTEDGDPRGGGEGAADWEVETGTSGAE